MIKPTSFLMCLIFSAFSIQCSSESSSESGIEPLQSDNNFLEYHFTHGWTGIVTSIKLFEDKSAVKYSNSSTVAVQFTEEEMRDMDTLLSQFDSLERRYHPQHGAWVDISTHDLVRHNPVGSDTVSILEPLDSQGIPEVLRNAVKVFESKL